MFCKYVDDRRTRSTETETEYDRGQVQGRVARPPRNHGFGQQHRGAAKRTTEVLLGMCVQKLKFDQKQ